MVVSGTNDTEAQQSGTQQVFLYSAKFICGSIEGSGDNAAADEPPVKPGNYATAINMHNVLDEPAHLKYWASIAFPANDGTGPVSGEVSVQLGARRAMELGCPQLSMLFAQPDFAQSRFVKGFVTIESDVEIEVAAVYTSEKLEIRTGPSPNAIAVGTGMSMDVEYIEPRIVERAVEARCSDIVFASGREPPPGGNSFPDIWGMDADGGQKTRVLDTQPTFPRSAAWVRRNPVRVLPI